MWCYKNGTKAVGHTFTLSYRKICSTLNEISCSLFFWALIVKYKKQIFPSTMSTKCLAALLLFMMFNFDSLFSLITGFLYLFICHSKPPYHCVFSVAANCCMLYLWKCLWFDICHLMVIRCNLQASTYGPALFSPFSRMFCVVDSHRESILFLSNISNVQL